MTPEKQKKSLHTQYPYYGVMMVKWVMQTVWYPVHCHSYSRHTSSMSADSETKPGNKTCIRILPDRNPNCEYGANGTFIFADSGLNQNPTRKNFCNRKDLQQNPSSSCSGRTSRCKCFHTLQREVQKHPDVDKW